MLDNEWTIHEGQIVHILKRVYDERWQVPPRAESRMSERLAHYLSAYALTATNPALARRRIDYEEKLYDVDNIGGHDLLSIVRAVCLRCSTIQRVTLKNEGDYAFRVTEHALLGREAFGMLEIGDIGTAANVVDTSVGTLHHEMGDDDAGLVPRFFHIVAPAGRSKALALFHTVQRRSARDALARQLKEELVRVGGGAGLHLRALTYEPLVRQWMEAAQVRAITATSNRPRRKMRDVADGIETDVEEATTLRARRRGESLFPMAELVRGRSEKSRFLQHVDRLQADGGDVTVTAALGGRTRRFSMSTDEMPVMNVEIDRKQVKFRRGSPDKKSLLKYSRSIAEEFLETF